MESFISFIELLEACRVNDLQTVKSMVEKDQTLLLKNDSKRDTVYHASASNGNLEIESDCSDDNNESELIL
jgi:ankyrin repeat protein